MDLREFNRVYGAEMARGQKLFNRVLFATIVVAIVFFYVVAGYLNYLNDLYTKVIITLLIFIVGILTGSFLQMNIDKALRAEMPEEARRYYAKFIMVRGGTLSFIIVGVYILAIVLPRI